MAISNFISTVWSENLLKNLDHQYVGILNCNREFEGDIKQQGSTVKICGVGSVIVSDYTKDTDMQAPETLSDYERTLEINQAKYFNFQIDDVDRAQCNPKLMDEAMKNAAAALANEADYYVFGLYDEAGTKYEEDSATPETIINTFIDIKTKLMNMNVMNPDDIVIEVSPDVAGLILKAKLELASDNQDVIEKGLIGKIAGSKVYVSNNIHREGSGHDLCYIRSKRSIAFAEQISEVEAYRPEKRFADAVKGLHLYGAKVVYPNEFIVLKVKTA